MSKINIYGTNSDKWKDALFNHVDKDIFPKCFGGNYVEDGDEKCCKSVTIKCNLESLIHTATDLIHVFYFRLFGVVKYQKSYMWNRKMRSIAVRTL